MPKCLVCREHSDEDTNDNDQRASFLSVLKAGFNNISEKVVTHHCLTISA